MLVVDNVLIGDDVIEKQFVCDLTKCKGGCCEEGDAGAPLEENELEILVELYDTIKPYLSETAIVEINSKGKYVYNNEFGWVTPTIGNDSGLCVYGKRDENGIVKCAFEQAYYDGKIKWKKPISCHLFPILIQKGIRGNYDRMNYEPRIKLCSPACDMGQKLKVPAYEFLKEAVIRKYGEGFYEALDNVAKKRVVKNKTE